MWACRMVWGELQLVFTLSVFVVRARMFVGWRKKKIVLRLKTIPEGIAIN